MYFAKKVAVLSFYISCLVPIVQELPSLGLEYVLYMWWNITFNYLLFIVPKRKNMSE